MRSPALTPREGVLAVADGRIPLNDLARMGPGERLALRAALERVLDSGWFVLGPEHANFELEAFTVTRWSQVVNAESPRKPLSFRIAARKVS